jgi:hypothetical protein
MAADVHRVDGECRFFDIEFRIVLLVPFRMRPLPVLRFSTLPKTAVWDKNAKIENGAVDHQELAKGNLGHCPTFHSRIDLALTGPTVS